MRKSSTMALVALLVLCSVVAVQAAPRLSNAQGTSGVGTKQGSVPLAAQSITQSTDPNTIGAGSSVACQGGATTDNGWWRLFDLDTDHGLAGTFTAENVDYGIETSVGTQNMTANVYCLDEGLPFFGIFLELKGSASQPQPDADLEFFNIAVPAGSSCDSAAEDMAVELHSDDCLESGLCLQLFIGMNGLGQSGPSYISAEDCGIVDPIDLAGIGFPNAHLVMVVNGDGEAGPGDDGGTDGGSVPASTGIGVLLMIALLLGSSAYFLRRKATN